MVKLAVARDDKNAGNDSIAWRLSTLRRALTTAGGHDPIETLHGIGYRIQGETR